MRGVFVRTMTAMGLALALSGCAGAGFQSATDRQMEQIKRMRERPRTAERNMINNAVLLDLSLAEFHFIPHSGELSGSGVARLDRMAPLLDTYGGTVRYAGEAGDPALVAERIAKVREYLSMTGCHMNRVDVEPGLPGGHGMLARHALEKQDKMDNPPDQGPGLVPTFGASSR